MIDEEGNATIDRAIQEVRDEDFSSNSPTMMAFQRLGDAAFDELARRIARGLEPSLTIGAMRCLGVLTKIVCFNRKQELLEIIHTLLKSESAEVRSAAANGSIWLLKMIEETSREPSGASGTRLRQATESALAMALKAGLDADQTEFVEEFLGTSAELSDKH